MYNPNDINVLNEKGIFYARTLWNLELDIPIIRNHKLRNDMGCLLYHLGEPDHIEVASYLLNGYYKETTIDSLLIHELTHWTCDKTGKMSSDNSTDFKEEISKIGCNASGEIGDAGIIYYSECINCGKRHTYQKTKSTVMKYVNNSNIKTICCNSKLKYGGFFIKEDDYQAGERIIELNKKFKKYYKLIDDEGLL